MIKSLTLVNFQRHERLSLTLDPNITTIIGPTDTGKSAILRSLRWLALNKPRGKSFLRWYEDKVSVTVELEKGRKVVRTQGTSNTYKLDGKKYSAMGAEVPTEIQEVLRLSSVNFQGQHDRHYWFSETPGEVARHLNELTDLSIIDTTMAKLKSMVKKAKGQEEVFVGRVEEVEKEVGRLGYMEELDRELRLVEIIEHVAGVATTKANRLEELVERATETHTSASNLRKMMFDSREVLNKAEACRSTSARASVLQHLLDAATETQGEAHTEVPDISDLEEVATRLSLVRSKITLLADLVLKAAAQRTIIVDCHKHAVQAEHDFKVALGDTCRLCGQRVRSSP